MTEYYGSCHCKEVKFSFSTNEILGELYKCNCTLCLKKAIIMKPLQKDKFKLLSGHNYLETYQWNKKIAKHFFCKTCGIYTHHNPRSNPKMTGFNVGCVDDIDSFNLKSIVVNDGQNHPLDKK